MKSYIIKNIVEVVDVKIVNNTERFQNPKSLDFEASSDFKIGEEFGPSFSTHWVKVVLQIPEDWLSQKYDI